SDEPVGYDRERSDELSPPYYFTNESLKCYTFLKSDSYEHTKYRCSITVTSESLLTLSKTSLIVQCPVTPRYTNVPPKDKADKAKKGLFTTRLSPIPRINPPEMTDNIRSEVPILSSTHSLYTLLLILSNAICTKLFIIFYLLCYL